MRYRYRGGHPELNATLSPEDLLRALADDLVTNGVDATLNRAMHQGLNAPDLGQFAGLDAIRHLIQRKIDNSWNAVDWDVVRTELASNPTDALGGGPRSLSERRRPSAIQPQQLRLDARLGRNGGLKTLVENLDEHAIPFTGLSNRLRVELEALRETAELLNLEARLGAIAGIHQLDEVDIEALRAHLASSEVDRFNVLLTALRRIRTDGFVRVSGGELQISPQALRVMARHFLEREVRTSSRGVSGQHVGRRQNGLGERTGSVHPLNETDPLDIDVTATVLNAARNVSGVPVRIRRDDFQVFDRERLEGRHTILAIDVSRSMGSRDYLPAAKRLSLALVALVEQRFVRDQVDFVAFSRTARALALHDIATLDWDRHHIGTNIQDALTVAQQLLRGNSRSQKHLILITDGEPTAHRAPDGSIRYEEPPSEAALSATLAAARRLKRSGVELTCALVGGGMTEHRFARQLAESARGQLIAVDPDSLEFSLIKQAVGMI